jgi:endoglucanase
MPGIKESEISTRVGNGPALTIVDGYGYADTDLREILASCGVKNQYKNMPKGGNDAGALKLNSIKTAAVSIPARYIHSPLSVVSEEDVKDCILLLKNFLDKEDL